MGVWWCDFLTDYNKVTLGYLRKNQNLPGVVVVWCGLLTHYHTTLRLNCVTLGINQNLSGVVVVWWFFNRL